MPLAMACNPVLGRSNHVNAANNVEELVKLVQLPPLCAFRRPIVTSLAMLGFSTRIGLLNSIHHVDGCFLCHCASPSSHSVILYLYWPKLFLLGPVLVYQQVLKSVAKGLQCLDRVTLQRLH